MYDYLIIGAGFAGSVLAERLAAGRNKKILVVDKRNHIGGNAYDEYDEHGILIHRYGPHIFHTNSRTVFDYLSKFTEWRFYEHTVMARSNGELYPIPINLLTLNKLYNLELKSEYDAREYLNRVRVPRNPILNSEDIIINQVGKDLFERFYKHYTFKQWNLEPKDLAPAVCGRIQVRYNKDCRYFTDKYQFMPKHGYTQLFRNMLAHKNTEIVLNTDYRSVINDVKFNHLIYTGAIDYFFDYQLGSLPYRSIRFEYENYDINYYQETAQINYVDDTVPYTRVVEHKRLSGSNARTTTVRREYPQKSGEPYYPVPSEENRHLYLNYRTLAEKLTSVTFCGRLAEYQYYNMDQVIGNALHLLRALK